MKTAMFRTVIALTILTLAVFAASAGDTKMQKLEEGQAVVTVSIEGMTCGGCCTKVEAAMGELDGVVAAKADYKAGSATITYVKDKVTVDTIVKTINEKTSFKAAAPEKA